MEREVVKAAVLGCGRIGAFYDIDRSDLLLSHCKGYHLHGRTELAWVVDPDKNQLEKAGDAYDCSRLSDFRELPLDSLGIVSICTPTSTHLEILRWLCEQGYSGKIILEKPAVSADEIADLEKLPQEFLDRIGVNYIRRFDPVYRLTSRRLRLGFYGDVVAIKVNYFGSYEHIGVHAINYLRSVLDSQPTVTAATSTNVEFDWGGVPVVFTQVRTPYNNFDIEFFTSSGKLVFDRVGYRLQVFQLESSDFFDGAQELRLHSEHEVLNGYVTPMIDMVLDGDEDVPSIREAVDDLKVMKDLGAVT